jgi:hypothetical protein
MSSFEWHTRTTSMEDSIDAYLHAGAITPTAPDSADYYTAIEWLSTFQADSPDEPIARAMGNVIAHLVRKADEYDRRKALTEAKRAYAAEHGIPVSKVRVTR